MLSLNTLSVIGLVLQLTAAATTTTTACSANNCLRAVRATNFQTRPVSSDCAAFQTRTSTPVTTVTTTITTTSTPAVRARRSLPAEHLQRRQAVASPKVPSYASACNSAAYASACSCIGVTASTATAASTSTSTVTVTQTSTAPAATQTFILKVNYPTSDALNPNIYIGPNPQSGFFVYLALQSSIAAAQKLTLAGNPGVFALLNSFTVYFDPTSSSNSQPVLGIDRDPAFNAQPAICAIDELLNFTCSYHNINPAVFFACVGGAFSGNLFIGESTSSFSQGNCDALEIVTLTVVPV